MAGQHLAGLQRASGGTIQLPLSWQEHRSGRPQAPDQGDRGDTGSVWLSPHPHPASTRRLGDQWQAGLPPLQGDGPTTAQESAQTSGEGEVREAGQSHVIGRQPLKFTHWHACMEVASESSSPCEPQNREITSNNLQSTLTP